MHGVTKKYLHIYVKNTYVYTCFPLIWNFINRVAGVDDWSEPLPGHLVDELVAADPGPGPVQAGAPVQLETPSDNNQMRNFYSKVV